MSVHKEVATLVRAARQMRGMSRESLAAAVGRSRTTIRRLEAASPDAVVPLDLPLAEALVAALAQPPQSARLLELGSARGTSVRGRWAPPQPIATNGETAAAPAVASGSGAPSGGVRKLLAQRFGAAATRRDEEQSPRVGGDAATMRRAVQQIARAAHAPLREGLTAVEWAAGVGYVVATLAVGSAGIAREGRITCLISEMATLGAPDGRDVVSLEAATRTHLEAWMQASGEWEALRDTAEVLAACWKEPDLQPVTDALLRGMCATAHAPRRSAP